MSLCPETDLRESLDDGEFWDYVFNGVKPGENPELDFDEPDDDTPEDYGGPCEVCGQRGACGYDALGRPLIHPAYAEDEP